MVRRLPVMTPTEVPGLRAYPGHDSRVERPA
jgi:hypothetical protein